MRADRLYHKSGYEESADESAAPDIAIMLTIATTLCKCFLPGHVIQLLVCCLLLGPSDSCFVKQNCNAHTKCCVKREGNKIPAEPADTAVVYICMVHDIIMYLYD